MIFKMQWGWERLDEGTLRAKVIGGWVLMHIQQTSIVGGKNKEMSQSESMVFIPDRDHQWTIVQPKADPVVERSAVAEDFKVPV